MCAIACTAPTRAKACPDPFAGHVRTSNSANGVLLNRCTGSNTPGTNVFMSFIYFAQYFIHVTLLRNNHPVLLNDAKGVK